MAWFEANFMFAGQVAPARVEVLAAAVLARRDRLDALDAFKPNRFPVFEDAVRHAVFKYPADRADCTSGTYFPWWPEWSGLIAPLIDEACALLGLRTPEVSRIMLATLAAGKAILPHVDRAEGAAIPRKIHIPIVTNPLVTMTIGRETRHLETGSVVEVNNRVMHSAENRGAADRVHLIFDCFETAAA